MKKLIVLIAILAIALTACEKKKEHEQAKKCPGVKQTDVPQTVTKSFNTKYPGVAVSKWFNKNNTGYSALFARNGKKTLTKFNNDGSFVNENNNIEQEGDHQDNENDCECETED